MRALLLLLLPVLAACGARPDVDALLGPEPVAAPYPDLLPAPELAAIETGEPEAEAEANAALLARAAALRARAAGIGP